MLTQDKSAQVNWNSSLLAFDRGNVSYYCCAVTGFTDKMEKFGLLYD